MNVAVQKLVETYGNLSAKRIIELVQTVNQTVEIVQQAQVEADAVYQTLVDDAGSGVTYVGEAAQGATAAGSAWRILKITTGSGDATIQLSPNYGTFGDVWNNRAGLGYS